MFKSMFLVMISSTSGANARKLPNRCSWLSFCRLLEPRPESHQIDVPGYHFVDFWSQGGKVFKSILLAMISSTSGANARKLPNRRCGISFCRLLEPRPESHQLNAPGYHFVDFWSKCQKVSKSMLLVIISLSSKANARKFRNLCSWLQLCLFISIHVSAS